jgi:uncharacterized protein
MNWWELLLLFVAGVGGGLAGSIAGLASVTTYPALLLVGLPPVSANVTNTVALVFNGVGSVSASLPELRAQRGAVVRLTPIAVAGGAAGATLLLTIPSKGFEAVVPILVALSAIVIAVPHRADPDPAPPSTRRSILVAATAFAICVYGGFFGAAAGILMLAMFVRTMPSLAEANAVKNVVLGIANAVAAVVFIVLSPVDWAAVVPLGIGCLLGARVGPLVVRYAPAAPIRWGIVVAALALAAKLGYDTYR